MGGGEDGSQRVLADAQAGLVSTLRPYKNFETWYQGQSGSSSPIMFSENGLERDVAAGTDGYDPNLLPGLSVPFGARIVVWLPVCGAFLPSLYNWLFSWRVRNVADFRLRRKAFHYPKQGPGASSTVGAAPGPRFVMPCCYQTVVYSDPSGGRAEPLPPPASGFTFVGSSYARVGVEQFQPVRSGVDPNFPLPMGFPILPGPTGGVLQQGITDSYDQMAGGDLGVPLFFPVDVTALGDELLIACTKDLPSLNNNPLWDFNDEADDLPFSRFFGQGGTIQTSTPRIDLGVYVIVVHAGP